jgi:uncharacterized membrane protein
MASKYKLGVRPPHHFSVHDFLNAVFGSFFVALTFLFKGGMTSIALNMPVANMIALVIFTFVIITFEIYMLGYRYVRKRAQRPFRQFWVHRFTTMVLASFGSIYLIMYLYGLDANYTHIEMLRIACTIFLPAAAAGAAMELLRKKRY